MSKESLCYKPKSLEVGDKIGLVNPVGEMSQEYADTAIPKVITYLERRGFRVVDQKITNKRKFVEGTQDPNILSDYYDPYTTDESEIRFNPYFVRKRSFLALSNPSPKERARLFNEAVANCDAILPLVGNRFGMDIINCVDYATFREQRPIFVTFSAASTFLLYLHLKTNTVVFYGPHIHFLASSENSYTVSFFWNLLKQKEPTSVLKNIYSLTEESLIPPSEKIPFFSYKTDQTSSLVAGKLIPIFLFSLQEALAQRNNINFNSEGMILMVEADERNYDDCLAALQSVHQQTDLSKLSALVLASFIAFKPESAALRDKLLNPREIQGFVLKARRLLKDNVPVIYGFPMGHSKYKLTIPMGVQAELDIETGDITLKESPFSNI